MTNGYPTCSNRIGTSFQCRSGSATCLLATIQPSASRTFSTTSSESERMSARWIGTRLSATVAPAMSDAGTDLRGRVSSGRRSRAADAQPTLGRHSRHGCLRHAYDRLSLPVIWHAIQDELPALEADVQAGAHCGAAARAGLTSCTPSQGTTRSGQVHRAYSYSVVQRVCRVPLTALALWLRSVPRKAPLLGTRDRITSGPRDERCWQHGRRTRICTE